MNLMMLCAGEGTRLRPYTDVLPKPAIPFLTVPMVSFFLEWAREVPVETVCVNTFHLPQKIEALFKSLPLPGTDLAISSENDQLLDTGGGLGHARRFVHGSGTVLLMNGDEVFFPTSDGQLKAAYESHRSSNRIATIVVTEHPEVGTKFGGVWVDDEDCVLGFAKKPWPGAARGYHYIGAMFLDDRVFKYLPEAAPANILYDALTAAMKDGDSVAIHRVRGFWHESGNPQDYLDATEAALDLLKHETNESVFLKRVLDRLSPGWSLRTLGGVSVLVGGGAALPEDVVADGFAVVGPQVQVCIKTRLLRAVLAPQKQIPLAGDLRGLVF